MRKISAPLTTGMALLTILATIIAPLCGPLCAVANRCMAARGSEGTDCHHAAMPNGFDALQTHFVAPRLCASRDFPPATLNPNKNWDELRYIQASAAPMVRAVVGTLQLAPSLGAHLVRWRSSPGPYHTHVHDAQITELRI
jgi:hypothetical protein